MTGVKHLKKVRVRRPAKSRKSTVVRNTVDRDPFVVVGAIPKGRSYQWVAKTVHGLSNGVQWNAMKNAGWRPVPASRHPRMPRVGRKIEFGGQVLMENASERVDDAVKRDIEAARKMHADHPASMRSSEHGVPAKAWSVFPVTAATDYHSSDGQSRTIKCEMTLRLGPHLVEAAVICGLSVEEYARRMLCLVLVGGLSGVLVPTFEGDAFELRDLMLCQT